MEGSYKNLVNAAMRGSLRAKLELNQRSYVNTGLVGINDESIVYRITDEIETYISYIDSSIDSVKSNKNFVDSVLLDSYSSATIEGAQTTVENVKRCIESPVTKSDKMVVNTLICQCLVYDKGIYKSSIRSIWEKLVEDVCENEGKRGSFYRSGMVYVGSATQIIHTPESVNRIEMQMDRLFDFCNHFVNNYIKACIVHFYFVYIHPFCDGNGRFARLWCNKILYDINPRFKDLVLSREIEKNLNSYYSSLHEAEFSYNNMIDITPFIEYLLAVIAGAVDYMTVQKYMKLSDLDNTILNKINRDGLTLSKLSKILGVDDIM